MAMPQGSRKFGRADTPVAAEFAEAFVMLRRCDERRRLPKGRDKVVPSSPAAPRNGLVVSRGWATDAAFGTFSNPRLGRRAR
jgi:hypothetical protein